jgi:DNA-binding response OmpR family regulator
VTARILLTIEHPDVADALRRQGHETVAGGDPSALDLGIVGAIADVRRLRGHGHRLPLLAVLAGTTVDRTIAAFEAGTDDVVPAPASAFELVARVQAILRRTRRHEPEPDRSNVVETYIGYLRRKLEPNGGAPITTVRQVGYRLGG